MQSTDQMQSTEQNAERSATLIIPTLHSRGALFARVLRYLSSAGFQCPIIVSDHSPPEQLNVIADIVKRHDKLDLTLLQHSPDIHFLERLTLCAQAAVTPYVHLHADDDFLIRRTLIALIEVMAAKPGCAAVMGLNAHIQIATAGLKILAKSAVEQADPFLRLIAQLENYSSVLYALRRRDEFIATMSFAVTRCPDVQFFQYLESCVSVLAVSCAASSSTSRMPAGSSSSGRRTGCRYCRTSTTRSSSSSATTATAPGCSTTSRTLDVSPGIDTSSLRSAMTWPL